jgi:hypothetical protein
MVVQSAESNEVQYASPIAASVMIGEAVREPVKAARVAAVGDADLRRNAFVATQGTLVRDRFTYSNGAFDCAANDARFDPSTTASVLARIVNGQPSLPGAALLDLVFDVFAFERTIVAHSEFTSLASLAEPSVEVSFDVEVDLSFDKKELVQTPGLGEPRLVVLLEFAFLPADLGAPLSMSRLPPEVDLVRLARAGESAWREPFSTPELERRFVTLAAFSAPTRTTSSRRYTRAVPLPSGATHARIVSDRVLHRTADSSKLHAVVVRRDQSILTGRFDDDRTAIAVICPPAGTGCCLENRKLPDVLDKRAAMFDVRRDRGRGQLHISYFYTPVVVDRLQ